MSTTEDLQTHWRAFWTTFTSAPDIAELPARSQLDMALAPFVGNAAARAIKDGRDPAMAGVVVLEAVRSSGTHQPWEIDAAQARISAQHKAEVMEEWMRRRASPIEAAGARYIAAASAVWLAGFALWYYLIGQHHYWHDKDDAWLYAAGPPALLAFAYRAWRWAARR